MDYSTLESLAESGFEAVHGDQLPSLIHWSREWGIATGDARFTVIADVLGTIDAWWVQHDERGGVPSEALREIERVLCPGLTDALAASTPAGGAEFAHQAGMNLPLSGPADWERQGWVRRGRPDEKLD